VVSFESTHSEDTALDPGLPLLLDQMGGRPPGKCGRSETWRFSIALNPVLEIAIQFDHAKSYF
jgi:hypothetical protein